MQEVAAWPDAVIAGYRTYLSREPAPIERVEIAVAQLTALTHNANRSENTDPRRTVDFLLFEDAWTPQRDAIADQLTALDNRTHEPR